MSAPTSSLFIVFWLAGTILLPPSTGTAYSEELIVSCTIKVYTELGANVNNFDCENIEVFGISKPLGFKHALISSPMQFGCGRVRPVSSNHSNVAIVGNCACSLNEKAVSLSNAGYVAFIYWEGACNPLRRDESPPLRQDNETSIIGIYVKAAAGKKLQDYSKANGTRYYVDFDVEVWNFTTILLIFIGVFLAMIVLMCFCFCCFIGFRYWQTRPQRSTLSNRALNRMTKRKKYRVGVFVYDTCSICLDEFADGEDVRELPCQHVYHDKCVDNWLKNYRDSCPNCKLSISKKGKSKDPETEPLLSPNATGGYGTVTSSPQDHQGTNEESGRISGGETESDNMQSDQEDVQASITLNRPSRSGLQRSASPEGNGDITASPA